MGVNAAIPLPTGTVTFLFTDIEGSTKLWERLPEAMKSALACHDLLMRRAITTNGGMVFKTVGDAFCAAFPTATEAVAAALDAQRFLQTEPWEGTGPIRVRMALHAGAAEIRDADYFGPPLNRTARLLAIAHSGQTLLSQAAYELARDALPEATSLRDLGTHRLKDLQRPEHVYQLLHPDLPVDFPPLNSLDIHSHNLPLQPTRFIGREQEMATVRELLAGTRLLTLVGTGGCGKTRLALQVAADQVEAYPDGVWLVELASLQDSTRVAQAVATVVGVREEPGRPLLQTLLEATRGKRLLLLLDNCEHLIEAAASLATELLRSCPHVHLLVTSREGLGIAGETVWRVPSLSVPVGPRAAIGESRAPDGITTGPAPGILTQYESVRLFIDRAVQARPEFTVTNDNAPAVAAICYHLDGIPLAIELAAAQARALSVEQIAARLDDRFRLLVGGNRACPGSRRCARRWTGATTCSPRKSGRCCAASRCSRAAAPWRRRNRSAAEMTCRATRSIPWQPGWRRNPW
jgi:class 3 adenylate cyclase